MGTYLIDGRERGVGLELRTLDPSTPPYMLHSSCIIRVQLMALNGLTEKKIVLFFISPAPSALHPR